MSRPRRIAFWALGAVPPALVTLGAVSSGCLGEGRPAPRPGEAATGQAAQADTLYTCGAAGNPGVSGTGQNGYNANKNAYYGNLHQHTSLSLDAYNWGLRTTPDLAYAFAKGPGAPNTAHDTCSACDGSNCSCTPDPSSALCACAGSTTGGCSDWQCNAGTALCPVAGVPTCVPTVQVAGGAPTTGPNIYPQRPLDFLAITDHSEWMSVVQGCANASNPAYGNITPAECATISQDGWYDHLSFPAEVGASAEVQQICGTGQQCSPEYADAWNVLVGDANNAYDPCYFSSLVAYEWTGMVDDANAAVRVNHRNVIFNNGSNVPAAPCDSLYCAPTPPQLWATLDRTCVGSTNGSVSCEAVTIPHNSNQSNGLSLQVWTPGNPADQINYEVAAEIYQNKGNSECFQGSGTEFGIGYPSGADTQCGFENIAVPNGATDQPLSYVRGALELGITIAADAGIGQQANPLQLGIVGATDDHNAAPGYVEEEVFVGHHGSDDDTTGERLGNAAYRTYGSGGITGVWAEQNTRDRIFAAIQRRETWATSGPRIKVRFYQTNLTGDVCADTFPGNVIDAGGIPMGGMFAASDLPPSGNPSFVIKVVPDTYTQIGPDTSGESCTIGGGECPSGMTCCAPGTTATAPCVPFAGTANACVGPVPLWEVQVIKAHARMTSNGLVTYEDAPYVVATNPTGTFCGTWTDTSTFNADQYAFYYVRVLQVPTYRWSHWDCIAAGLGTGCDDTADTLRERAWTSPIWYTPGGCCGPT